MPDIEEINDDSLFDDAVEGAENEVEIPAPEEVPVEQAAAEPEKAEEATTEASHEGGDAEDDGSPVPSGRFRQAQEAKRLAQAERDILKLERDRLAFEQQEFRRRLAQLETPQQAKAEDPDPLLDPRGYREFMERRFEERLTNERREMSLQMARRAYKDEFDEAYTTAQKHVDPALRARMQQSSDPGETLIGWYRELKVRAEVGNDPKAYREKVRSEFLKDPEFRKAAMEAWRGEASTQAKGRPNTQLPPSMNGISRSAAALRSSQEDFSDDALWDKTTT
jgi:hypothetical protein